MAKDGKSKTKISGTLMAFALRPIENEAGRVGAGIYVNEAKPCFDVVDTLLNQGANPNEVVGRESVWETFLLLLDQKQGLRGRDPAALVPWAKTARLFLTQLQAHDRLPANVVGWMRPLRIFERVFLPEVALEIENMIAAMDVKRPPRQSFFRRVIRRGVDVGLLPRSRF